MEFYELNRLFDENLYSSNAAKLADGFLHVIMPIVISFGCGITLVNVIALSRPHIQLPTKSYLFAQSVFNFIFQLITSIILISNHYEKYLLNLLFINHKYAYLNVKTVLNVIYNVSMYCSVWLFVIGSLDYCFIAIFRSHMNLSYLKQFKRKYFRLSAMLKSAATTTHHQGSSASSSNHRNSSRRKLFSTSSSQSSCSFGKTAASGGGGGNHHSANGHAVFTDEVDAHNNHTLLPQHHHSPGGQHQSKMTNGSASNGNHHSASSNQIEQFILANDEELNKFISSYDYNNIDETIFFFRKKSLIYFIVTIVVLGVFLGFPQFFAYEVKHHQVQLSPTLVYERDPHFENDVYFIKPDSAFMLPGHGHSSSYNTLTSLLTQPQSHRKSSSIFKTKNMDLSYGLGLILDSTQKDRLYTLNATHKRFFNTIGVFNMASWKYHFCNTIKNSDPFAPKQRETTTASSHFYEEQPIDEPIFLVNLTVICIRKSRLYSYLTYNTLYFWLEHTCVISVPICIVLVVFVSLLYTWLNLSKVMFMQANMINKHKKQTARLQSQYGIHAHAHGHVHHKPQSSSSPSSSPTHAAKSSLHGGQHHHHQQHHNYYNDLHGNESSLNDSGIGGGGGVHDLSSAHDLTNVQQQRKKLVQIKEESTSRSTLRQSAANVKDFDFTINNTAATTATGAQANTGGGAAGGSTGSSSDLYSAASGVGVVNMGCSLCFNKLFEKSIYFKQIEDQNLNKLFLIDLLLYISISFPYTLMRLVLDLFVKDRIKINLDFYILFKFTVLMYHLHLIAKFFLFTIFSVKFRMCLSRAFAIQRSYCCISENDDLLLNFEQTQANRLGSASATEPSDRGAARKPASPTKPYHHQTSPNSYLNKSLVSDREGASSDFKKEGGNTLSTKVTAGSDKAATKDEIASLSNISDHFNFAKSGKMFHQSTKNDNESPTPGATSEQQPAADGSRVPAAAAAEYQFALTSSNFGLGKLDAEASFESINVANGFTVCGNDESPSYQNNGAESTSTADKYDAYDNGSGSGVGDGVVDLAVRNNLVVQVEQEDEEEEDDSDAEATEFNSMYHEFCNPAYPSENMNNLKRPGVTSMFGGANYASSTEQQVLYDNDNDDEDDDDIDTIDMSAILNGDYQIDRRPSHLRPSLDQYNGLDLLNNLSMESNLTNHQLDQYNNMSYKNKTYHNHHSMLHDEEDEMI